MAEIKNRRISRHRRLRMKISGTPERPRLCVFKSNLYIYAQLIDDTVGKTVGSSSNMKGATKGCNIAAAKVVGAQIAESALKNGIKEVAFDRSGYRYHGCVRALADAAREAGLKF